MRRRPFSRTAGLFAGSFLTFSFLVAGHASAAPVETCPATALWMPQASPAGSVSVVLAADGPRALTAQFEAYTDKGFFSATLPDVSLMPKPGSTPDPNDAFAYRSPVLAVQFPAGVKIYESWLRTVTVTQGQADWLAAGPIRCFPFQGDPKTPRPSPKAKGPQSVATPEPLHTPDPAFAPIAAVVAPGLERMDCRHPFFDAVAIKAVAPSYPAGGFDIPTGTASILIVLDPHGKVVGTSVFRSSGSYRMDVAAQQAAAASTYLPSVAFCQAIYGRYIFKATFRPS